MKVKLTKNLKVTNKKKCVQKPLVAEFVLNSFKMLMWCDVAIINSTSVVKKTQSDYGNTMHFGLNSHLYNFSK